VSTLTTDTIKPGTACTARARHRRQVPCTPYLSRLDALMRDLRHEAAAAFTDLNDWLAWLDGESKRPKTIYGYMRVIAPPPPRPPRQNDRRVHRGRHQPRTP